jgi:hypothetical protein
MPEGQIDNTHNLILNHFTNYKIVHNTKKNKTDIQDFLEDLTKPNVYLALQSVLDAIDIQLSLFKFYFEAFFQYDSQYNFKNFIAASFGKMLYSICALFLGSLSFIANLDIDKVFAKTPVLKQIAQQADTIWPFFRDACKAIKWTHKGLLSMVTIFQVFFPWTTSIIPLFSLCICFIAMTNRLNNRYIIENRKNNQSLNRSNVELYDSLNLFFIKQKQDFIKNFNNSSQVLKKIFNGKFIQIEYQSQKRIYIVKNNQLTLLYLHISKEQLSTIIKTYPLQALQEYANKIFLCENQFYSFELNQHNQITWHQWSEQNSVDGFNLKLVTEIEALFEQFDLQQYSKLISNMNINIHPFENELLHELQKEPNHQPFVRHAKFSAFLTGLLNAPYYFLGILALVDYKNLTTHFQTYGLRGCEILIIFGCMSEYYQEADYQRKLHITEEYSKISIYKQLIIQQYNQIFLYTASQLDQSSMSPREIIITTQNQIKSQLSLTEDNKLKTLFHLPENQLITEPIKIDYDSQFKKLNQYIEEYSFHMNKEKELLHLDKKALFWSSIRSSLQIISIFTNIMVLLKSIPTIDIKSFPDWTINVYGGFSVAAVGYSFRENYFNLNTCEIVGKTKQLAVKKQNLQQSLLGEPIELVEYLNNDNLHMTNYKMFAEQCDMVRQPISGAKKGLKNIENFITPTDDKHDYHPSHQLFFLLTSGVYAVFFALKSTRMSLRVDNEAYKSSYFFKRFYKTELTPENIEHQKMILENDAATSLSQ